MASSNRVMIITGSVDVLWGTRKVANGKSESSGTAIREIYACNRDMCPLNTVAVAAFWDGDRCLKCPQILHRAGVINDVWTEALMNEVEDPCDEFREFICFIDQ